MKTLIINFIISGIIIGLSDGAGVLPDSHLNGYVNGTVRFRTNLNPAQTPFYFISWTFGAGSPIVTLLPSSNKTSPEYAGRITFYRSTGSLELRNLKLSDGGEYTITITTANSSQRNGHTRLDINDPGSNVSLTPSSTDLVEFNSSVRLFCSFSGHSLSLLWMNSSSEITASDRVQITDEGATLTIVNVTRYDQGPYSCHVFSSVSNASSESVNLSVSYGPENTQLKVSPLQNDFDRGSNVNLSCSAESKPSAQFLWFLNGDLLPDTGPELRLVDLQMSQSGNYSCQAFNNKTLRFQTSLPAVISVQDTNTPGGLSGGAIAGIVITCLIVAAAGAAGGYFIYNRRKKVEPEPHSGRTEQENVYVNMPRIKGNKEDHVYENVGAIKSSKEPEHVYEDMSKIKKS